MGVGVAYGSSSGESVPASPCAPFVTKTLGSDGVAPPPAERATTNHAYAVPALSPVHSTEATSPDAAVVSPMTAIGL